MHPGVILHRQSQLFGMTQQQKQLVAIALQQQVKNVVADAAARPGHKHTQGIGAI